MAAPAWQMNGQYYETCSCDYVCPCLTHGLTVRPSKGTCTFAMGFQIEHGAFGNVKVDGLGFVVLGFTPEAMGKGNWSVGLLLDDRASSEQRDAMTTMASGQAGGPMAALSGLFGKFLGAQPASIRFERSGVKWSVSAPGLVDMAAEGAMGMNPHAPEPLRVSNAGHPAADTLLLAHAVRSRVNALGLSWEDTSGTNNGQYAPFAWRSS